jgi:predicted transcriptional regulator
VFEALEAETGWAFSTVKTMLTRLTEKDALAVETRGGARFFSPRVTAREARRSALRSLVDRAFGGAFSSLVQHMVSEGEVSGKDREALEAMIREEFGDSEGETP